MLPKSKKKSFINGIVKPAKIGSCDECRGKTLCATCNFQINDNKDFEANLYSL